jgi:hypothetical protein
MRPPRRHRAPCLRWNFPKAAPERSERALASSRLSFRQPRCLLRPTQQQQCMYGRHVFPLVASCAGPSRMYRVCCLPPAQPSQILSIQDGGRSSPSLLDLRLDHKQTRKDVNVRRAKRAIPWPFRYDITADTFNHRARQRRRYRSFLLMPASPDLGRMSC